MFSLRTLRLVWVLHATLLCAYGCGGDSGSPAAPTPTAGLEVSCAPPSLSNVGCGSTACSVTGTRGFSGPVTLSCSGQPAGVNCGFGPNPVTLALNGTEKIGLTVSAGPSAPQGIALVRVVATGGGLVRTTDLNLALAGMVGPAPTTGMVAFGCAGYTAETGSPLQQFRSVFVGSWRDGSNGSFCAETLGETNGAFALQIPGGCRIAEGAPVYLTAGGLSTCVTVPYHAGTSVFVDLLGRYTACP